MNKKLGHNPLGGNHLEGAKFDFIPFTNKGAALSKTQPKKKHRKKIVSYYLEEDLIREIKELAKNENISFSHCVGSLLTSALRAKKNE